MENKITKTTNEKIETKGVIIIFGILFVIGLWLYFSHHSFFGEMFMGAALLGSLMVLSRSSTAAAKTSGVAMGIGMGGILIVLGIICFSIPVIGWIIGVIFILFGIAAPFGGIRLNSTSFQRVQGECPRCGNKLLAHKTDKALTCKVCKRRILVTDKGFELA